MTHLDKQTTNDKDIESNQDVTNEKETKTVQSDKTDKDNEPILHSKEDHVEKQKVSDISGSSSSSDSDSSDDNRRRPKKRINRRLSSSSSSSSSPEVTRRRVVLTEDEPIDLTKKETSKVVESNHQNPPNPSSSQSVPLQESMSMPTLVPFHESSSAICTTLTGVTRQLVILTQTMNQVCTRIEDSTSFQKSKPPEIRNNRFEIASNHVMGDVRAELRVLNGTCSQLTKAVMEMNKTHKEQNTIQKSQHAQMSSLMNGVMTCMNTFGHIVTDFSKQMESKIDTNHLTNNFEQEWRQAEREAGKDGDKQRPRYPYIYKNHCKNHRK